MTDVLLALVSGAVGIIGGYIGGVLRALNERRNAALAEIFKEMSLFYRYFGSWIEGINPDSCTQQLDRCFLCIM